MLLALSTEEAQGLQERVALLQQNGIRAEYHPSKAVKQLEPALTLPQAGGALLVESDSQLVSTCVCTCTYPATPTVTSLLCIRSCDHVCLDFFDQQGSALSAWFKSSTCLL